MGSETVGLGVNCGAAGEDGILTASELADWGSARGWGTAIPRYVHVHFFIFTIL
jgi:hypothetical protein